MSVNLIVVKEENPLLSPDIKELISELDKYLTSLYPAESNHLLPLESLAVPHSHFIVARKEVSNEAVGCGAVLICNNEDNEEIAKEKEIKVLNLETGIHQSEALKFFERENFVKCCPPFGDYPKDDPLSLFYIKAL